MPSNHERRLPSRPDTRHRLRLVRLLIALLAAIAAIAAMECIVFNLPFWRTLGASTDTNAVHNTLGSGLTRRNDGMLTVTDPTKAYLELTADGTSDYLRIDTESSKVIDKAREQAEAESKANDDKEVFKPLATIHVRADVDGITGKAQSMNPDAIRSHYVKAPGAGIVRIWIQEERGAIVPVTDARANVRVPFVINWMRVLAMALVLLMIAVWSRDRTCGVSRLTRPALGNDLLSWGLWRFLPCLSAHPSSTNCGTRLRSSSTFPAITPMISTSMGMWPMRWSPAGPGSTCRFPNNWPPPSTPMT